MLDIAFRYKPSAKKWVECTRDDYAHAEIEKLPIILIVRYCYSNCWCKYDTKYVFCRKHRRMEEIADVDDEQVTSADGCHIEGLISYGYFQNDVYYYPDSTIYVPFRWRIFQRKLGGIINIACDVAKVTSSQQGVLMRWINVAIVIDTAKERVCEVNFGAYVDGVKDWQPLLGEDIPEAVINTGINLLREVTFQKTGIYPSILSQVKGYDRLMAYLERPFDINIVFLKQFLRQYIKDDFETVFPYDSKDNYRKICELLAISPPKSLRRAYAYNPYAIVWYMIFMEWGIKDINLMQKFFYLDDCVANMYLNKFYFDAKNRQVERDDYDSRDRWLAVEFYCIWLLQHHGEKKFLRWLYNVSAVKEMSQEQIDAIMSFYRYHDQLSQELKACILRDGLTQYVHDAISWEVNVISQKLDNIRLVYKPNILGYECKIKDYEFHLVHQTSELIKVGISLENCVATYRDDVRTYHSIIVYVKHHEEFVACIEIQKERKIVQALGKKNYRLTGEVLSVCRYWMKKMRLQTDVDHLDSDDDNNHHDWQDVCIEAIPYKKAMEELSRKELLELPSSDIEPGYYTQLGEQLINETYHAFSAPSWMKFADEKSFLKYVFPQGEKIYDAAFAGNTEAMRTLGFMYYRGRTLKRDYDKAINWLLKASDLGDMEAAGEGERLQKYLDKEL